MVFLAGKLPNIRSYTDMYIQYFWQGNYQIYGHQIDGHIRCKYMVMTIPTSIA